nr:phage-related tail fiber protein [uncultured Mediterranean phage uvMED]
MADKRITELQPLEAAAVQGSVDVLAVADVSAAETKKIKVGDLVAAGLAGGVPDGSIPGSKIEENTITSRELAPDSVTDVELADNAVDTDAIQDGAVTTEKLADSSVTSNKLAADSVTTDKIADGAVGGDQIADRSIPAVKLVQNTLTADEIAPNAIGASELADNAVDTPALADNAVSTPKLQDASVTEPKLADGAVTTNKIADGAVTVNKLADGAVTDDKIDGIGLDKLPNAGSATVLAGPVSGAAATPSYRKLEPTDIPTASTTTKGGVSVPASGGLAVDGAGAVGIGNSVTPNEFPVISYNEHGLVTNGRALSNSDLPPPALGEIGGVKAGDGITITPDGTISQSLTGVAAETYTKVTVDEMGSVTAGAELVADDIPQIPWDKIENPVVGSPELSDKSVQMRHLADYSIAFIQEQQPTVDQNVHIGTFWFKESTASLSQWNGNSWMSVGIGRLSAENLRFCGIFDATTGFITGLTQFGVAEGYEIGKAIPAATDDQTGVYFVCQVAGDQVAVLPGITLDAGDWALCNGSAGGWERIDTMSGGGGGGGGAVNLGDLLDVNIGAATTGALLQLQASGQWQDIYSIDGGDY